MTLGIDVWQLLSVAGAVVLALASATFTVGKLLIGQFERRLDDRFEVQESSSRATSQRHWDARFLGLEQAAVSEAKEWQRIEREILTMKADLPVQYIRRDDYIRNQTIIEAKIDGLAMRIENALLKRGQAHG